MPALQNLESNTSVREDFILETRHLLFNIRNPGIEVQLCWVPAHIASKVMKKLKKAKEALGKELVEINTSTRKGEIKAKIKGETMQIWHKEWESEMQAKRYHMNQAKVGRKG